MLDAIHGDTTFDFCDLYSYLSDKTQADVVAHVASEGRRVVQELTTAGLPLPVKLFLDIDDTLFVTQQDDSFPVTRHTLGLALRSLTPNSHQPLVHVTRRDLSPWAVSDGVVRCRTHAMHCVPHAPATDASVRRVLIVRAPLVSLSRSHDHDTLLPLAVVDLGPALQRNTIYPGVLPLVHAIVQSSVLTHPSHVQSTTSATRTGGSMCTVDSACGCVTVCVCLCV